MNTATLTQHAKTLQSIAGFFESEKQRIASILHLAGISEAKLQYALPSGEESDRNKILDALGLSLNLTYTHQERTFTLPSLKLGAVTYDGVPVLQQPGNSQSLSYLTHLTHPEVQTDEALDELREVLDFYKGQHPSEAFSQIATKLLLEQLNEQPKSETNPVDG